MPSRVYLKREGSKARGIILSFVHYTGMIRTVLFAANQNREAGWDWKKGSKPHTVYLPVNPGWVVSIRTLELGQALKSIKLCPTINSGGK